MLLNSYSKGWTSPHHLQFVRKNLWITFFLKAGWNSQRPVHSVVFRVKSFQHWFDLATDNRLTNMAKHQQAVIFFMGLLYSVWGEFGKKILKTSDPKHFNNCMIWFSLLRARLSLPCNAESMLWHFYPPRSRRNIRSLCFHCTESSCILHFREEVQAATTELKVKELEIKGKYLSGEKAEGLHRKLLLGCSDAPLPSSALSNQSVLCMLTLLSSLTISFRPSN